MHSKGDSTIKIKISEAYDAARLASVLFMGINKKQLMKLWKSNTCFGKLGFVTRLTRRVSLMAQELFTLPEHMSSPPVISGIRTTRALVL